MASINIKYTSFAAAPEGISLTKTYLFKNDSGKSYIVANGAEIEMDLEEIKMLFTPVESDWETVLGTKRQLRKLKKKRLKSKLSNQYYIK